MKDIMLSVLRRGFSSTKKYKVEDLSKKLFILDYIFSNVSFGISVNSTNEFWKDENKENRIRLINDISNIRKFNVRDTYYFRILNEVANGNRYGIRV